MKRTHVLEFSRPDIDGDLIKAVKVIGVKSKHGWSYPADVLKEAMPLYEGSPVFIEHPDAREKAKGHRQLADHFGSLENIRGNGQGLFADLKVRQSHPLATSVLEAAPTARFGLSHNALVDLNEDKSRVLKIVQVNSVDLVDKPGTTENLFEQGPVQAEFQTILESLEAIAAELKAEVAAAKSKPANTPPERLLALETTQPGDRKAIGDDHEAFLRTLRG
jgi:hypothetical protein